MARALRVRICRIGLPVAVITIHDPVVFDPAFAARRGECRARWDRPGQAQGECVGQGEGGRAGRG